MKYLLDTNAWIDCLKRPAGAVAQRVASHSPNELCTCSIVRTELQFGALKSNNPTARSSEVAALLTPFTSLSFDDRAADIHAGIRKQLSDSGTLIGPADLMIAAIAVANCVTIVTHNTSEFGRVVGLTVEDWQSPLPPVP